MRNAFKELEQKQLPPNVLPQIEQRVERSLDSFRFLGKIVEIYVPRVVHTIVELAGGGAKTDVEEPFQTPGAGPGEPPIA